MLLTLTFFLVYYVLLLAGSSLQVLIGYVYAHLHANCDQGEPIQGRLEDITVFFMLCLDYYANIWFCID